MNYPILKFAFNKNHYYDNSWFHAFWYEDFFGNILSKEKYRYAKSFNEGYAFVYKADKTWDIINAIGESEIKNFKCSYILKISLKYVLSKDSFFIKNYKVDDNLIIGVNWIELKKIFYEMDIKVKYATDESIKHGYLIININTGILSIIEDYTLDGNGMIAIKHFRKNWIFIDIKSFRFHLLEKKIFDPEFEYACGFRNGLAKVKRNGNFGFINTYGDFIIEPIFDDARSFYKGFAAVAIANCRKNISKWNSGVRNSDLAWNFIDKSKKVLLKEPKEALSMINLYKSYYFKNHFGSKYQYEEDNLNSDYFIEFNRRGLIHFCFDDTIGDPLADCCFNSNIWGQFYPNYLVDLLTAQIHGELGFKKWFVVNNPDLRNAYYYIGSRNKVTAESIYIDFDTTQTELDYILNQNSLISKYGIEFTDGAWKTKRTPNYTVSKESHFETDWSKYNDDLDMDQQSIDFWNQF